MTNRANWIVGDYTLDYSVTDQCGNEGTSTLTITVNNTVDLQLYYLFSKK
jgi:hypothetical protein